MKLKGFNEQIRKGSKWIMTEKVYNDISSTIGTRLPEQGAILGSSDGIHIDYYYFDSRAKRTGGSYTMDASTLNEVIHEWNDNGIRFIGVIHSHPNGVIKPSYGDAELAEHIIDSMDVGGELFTPIVQVSPNRDGNIRIYPYTFKRSVQMNGEALTIEKGNDLTKDERKLRQLHEISLNRFKRIESSFPYGTMSRKAVICVGCGGSRDFLENLARLGVSHFYLYDKDIVEDTNIATQGTFVSEIGKYKVDVIKERILDINPLAKVHCFNKFLDDTVNDEEFAFTAELRKHNPEDIILCGCTDDAVAQLRCELLSQKFGLPYLAAQIYAGGKGHEVVFTYPKLTKSCCMCMLGSRYKKIFSEKKSTGGSSIGTPVWVTNHLNAVKTYLALCILCFKEPDTLYYGVLRKYADKNYLQTKCNDEFTSPAFIPIDDVFKMETDLSLPIGTIAIGQEQEEECVVCSKNGLAHMNHAYDDTRILLNEIIKKFKEI